MYTSVLHRTVYSCDIIDIYITSDLIHFIVDLTGALIVAFYNTNPIYIRRIFTPCLIFIFFFILILVLIKPVVLLVFNSFFDLKVPVYIYKLIHPFIQQLIPLFAINMAKSRPVPFCSICSRSNIKRLLCQSSKLRIRRREEALLLQNRIHIIRGVLI